MEKRDIYQEVTDTIIETIEAGTMPWRKDWTATGYAGGLPRRSNGEYYNGINVLLLWVATQARGFTSDQWFTFNQAKAAGGNVRKGERGTGIVFYSTFEKENDNGDVNKVPFLKRYVVFNKDQIDGLRCDETPDLFPADNASDIPELAAFFAATGARIVQDGTNPAYYPSQDTIRMPFLASFETANGYYSTLSHELVHWTGHKSRLDRDKKYDTTDGRAFEELIAELGACFLMSRLGARPDFDNSASYVASWLKALRSDKRWIFKAASAAQKATDYALTCGNQATAMAAE